ncbi:MAG: 30S ribosomal protein S20, partial [Acidobacteriota bacterium]|nr:30S ribosomal protein S20 [Acidobacteriota bacterium]
TKSAVNAVGTENEESALRLAMKRIDKAAAKGVIHKNQAANKKSGLMKRLNALRSAN